MLSSAARTDLARLTSLCVDGSWACNPMYIVSIIARHGKKSHEPCPEPCRIRVGHGHGFAVSVDNALICVSPRQSNRHSKLHAISASPCHGCLCSHTCPFALNDPVLHLSLWLPDSEFCSCECLSYAHGCPCVEARLTTRHSGRALGQCHEDDELVLHPAHASQSSNTSLNTSLKTLTQGLPCPAAALTLTFTASLIFPAPALHPSHCTCCRAEANHHISRLTKQQESMLERHADGEAPICISHQQPSWLSTVLSKDTTAAEPGQQA